MKRTVVDGAAMIDAFYSKAIEFCEFVGRHTINKDSAERLIILLMELYICGLSLPNSEPAEGTVKADGYYDAHVKGSLKIDLSSDYWMVFDPYEGLASSYEGSGSSEPPDSSFELPDSSFELPVPVGGNLFDDLDDIARDLCHGIDKYDEGHPESAAFTWKLGLKSHWGTHAVEAIRRLHTNVIHSN